MSDRIDASHNAEIIEKDTEDPEDINDMIAFLLPGKTFPEDSAIFGVFGNRNILNGWVGTAYHESFSTLTDILKK